jgi:hypothetical protein
MITDQEESVGLTIISALVTPLKQLIKAGPGHMSLTSGPEWSRGALSADNLIVWKMQGGLRSADVAFPKEFRTSLGSFQQRNAPLFREH